jgi:tetratricopeptide (TPR) repeat protein
MKLLFLLFIVGCIGTFVYLYFSKVPANKSKKKKYNWKPIYAATLVVLILIYLLALGMYKSATEPDSQCFKPHQTTSLPPSSQVTATDYFMQGDYDYEKGDCSQAIGDYTKALKLNPSYPQAYNNRAYTYMRLRDYKDASSDLNKAIEINPNYIQALMNRGDLHNYYYQIDRQSAIADYEKVVSLNGPSSDTSVCGHLFLAKHNGWTLGAYLDFFKGEFGSCK